MIGVVIAACLAQEPQVSEWTHLPDMWSAHLESPGGVLPFGLTFGISSSGAMTAKVVNSSESIDVPVVEWSRERLELVLDFPHYDSRITAKANSNATTLTGVWRKRRSVSTWTEMPFEAVYAPRDVSTLWMSEPFRGVSRLRDELMGSGPKGPLGSGFFGGWSAKFRAEGEPCVARFTERGLESFLADQYGDFAGTFLTALGDYRYLSGEFDLPNDRITLACFDGAHAFLFVAKLLEDGSLAGDFWSGDTWHDTWSAVRDDNAKLPDPFGLTKVNEGVKLDELAFPDLDGALRKLGDPAFAGKARIVQIFGTWCPNCNDEARYLVELDQRYRGRGLSIVGLAFELTGDFQRDATQVKRYSERHALRFPILVAGVSDKQKASERFPLLDKVRAYPTTLFVDAQGRVRAVHQGFSGPATGAEHLKLREDFERLVEGLLAEAK